MVRRRHLTSTEPPATDSLIDGVRALAHIAGGRGELISRNGNVFPGFSELATWIAEHLSV